MPVPPVPVMKAEIMVVVVDVAITPVPDRTMFKTRAPDVIAVTLSVVPTMLPVKAAEGLVVTKVLTVSGRLLGGWVINVVNCIGCDIVSLEENLPVTLKV